jgi:hypothetical protein
VLGRLVGARRRTVSQALAAFRDEGLLGHAADRRWLLLMRRFLIRVQACGAGHVPRARADDAPPG